MITAGCILALVLELSEPKRSNQSIFMLQAFIDDSRTENPPVFVLAGYISTAKLWAAFSDEWQTVLDMRPRIAYLKMSEAQALGGEFLDWSEERRDERLRLFYAVIEKYVSGEFSFMLQPDLPLSFSSTRS